MHQIRTDKALYDYVQEIKNTYLRNAPQPSKVAFDGKLQTLQKALGIHTRIARVQGGKLKTKRENPCRQSLPRDAAGVPADDRRP